MIVEILFFEGCPHHQITVDMAREIAEGLGLTADVREVEVRDHRDAERLRFLGSPSVRVNGADIEPGAEGRADYALGCRMYSGSGVPPREMLGAALRAADSSS